MNGFPKQEPAQNCHFGSLAPDLPYQNGTGAGEANPGVLPGLRWQITTLEPVQK